MMILELLIEVLTDFNVLEHASKLIHILGRHPDVLNTGKKDLFLYMTTIHLTHCIQLFCLTVVV